jgi:uncharacterized protein
MKIVVDTNVIVSALLFKDSNPAFILNLIYNRICHPLMNSEIYIEYRNTLSRQKFQFTKYQIDYVLDEFMDNSELVLANPTGLKFLDEDDKKFYTVAETGRADFLITGNLKHFPKSTHKFQIVTAREFLENCIYQDQ